MSTYQSTHEARQRYMMSKEAQKAIAKREAAKVKPEPSKAPKEKPASDVKP